MDGTISFFLFFFVVVPLVLINIAAYRKNAKRQRKT